MPTPSVKDFMEDQNSIPDEPTFQSIMNLTAIYAEALLMEADCQTNYDNAKNAAQYRRDDIALRAYADGIINGGNERHKRLQEIYLFNADEGAAILDEYEEKAFKALTLASSERKRIEYQVSLTKAWLYSRSGGLR